MEKRIEFTLDDIDLNLVIDRLDTNQIVEYKTSSFDYKEADVNNWQTNLYIWVIWKTTGRILPMVYSVLNKKKVDKPKYKPQIITVTRTEKELEKVEQDLIKEVEKIKKEIFPSNPGSHCFYCPFSTRNNGLGNCKDSL